VIVVERRRWRRRRRGVQAKFGFKFRRDFD